MDAPVYISYFDVNTRAQFMISSRQFLGSKHKTKMRAGSLVVLVDLSAHEIFGIVCVRDAPDATTPCIEHAFLDADTYSAEYCRYNRYEVHIHNVRILKTPITYNQVRFLIGGEDGLKGAGNMWRGFHCNFAAPFQVGCDPNVVRRYVMWVNSIMNT